jgi:hypothetical protein
VDGLARVWVMGIATTLARAVNLVVALVLARVGYMGIAARMARVSSMVVAICLARALSLGVIRDLTRVSRVVVAVRLARAVSLGIAGSVDSHCCFGHRINIGSRYWSGRHRISGVNPLYPQKLRNLLDLKRAVLTLGA